MSERKIPDAPEDGLGKAEWSQYAANLCAMLEEAQGAFLGVRAEADGLRERVRSLEESRDMCLASDSPLPAMAKGVVRGFFSGTFIKDND